MTTPVSGSAGYIALPVEVDPDTLASDAIGYLAQQQPGWVAREGHLEVWMIRAFARMCAETAQVAAQVPLSIFQYFGTQLLGLPPLTGSPASMPSTWTFTDTLGHTVPAGTVVAYRVSVSQIALFQTTADFTVAAGASTTTPGAVTLQAVDMGTSLNGLPASALSLVSNLSYVASVASTGVTAGGSDVEDQTAYLDRLTAELQLLSPRPILASDYAALARNQAGVARATALDGYNPADSSSGNARMVAVAGIDSAGNPLPAATKTALASTLQAQREVNFVVNAIDPTYSTVKVSASLVAEKGYNTDAVTAAATAALKSFLSPANWGGPAPQWVNTSAVRYITLGALLNDIPGVQYVSGLQLAVGANTLANTDATLPGAIPLPAANPTITITTQ